MISYAQNFEDVVLARAFAGRTDGFYVDVGAMDPTFHSVTRHFYELGWRGINVEPNPEFYQKLLTERPRDLNLHCGISSERSLRSLVCFEHEGLSSFDVSVGDRFPTFRHATIVVPTCRLSDIAPLCASEVQFLKIDVEGWERYVLESADFRVWRPEVIVVESVDALNHAPNWQPWEPLLTGADYQFVYFDGLNRYYVRAESADLRRCFDTPPNVFDQFQVADVLKLENELADLRRRLDEAQSVSQPHPDTQTSGPEETEDVAGTDQTRLESVESALLRVEDMLRGVMAGKAATAPSTPVAAPVAQAPSGPGTAREELEARLRLEEARSRGFETELAAARAFIGASQTENTNLRSELAFLSARAAESQNEIGSRQTRIAQLEQQLTEARSQADASRQEVALLSDRVARVQGQLQPGSALSADTQSAERERIRELEAELSATVANLAAAQQNSELQAARTKQVETEVVTLATQFSGHQRDLEWQRARTTQLEAELAAAGQEVASRKADTERLQAELDEARARETAAIQSTRAQVDGEYSALRVEVVALRAENAALRETVGGFAGQMASLTASLTSLQDQNSRLTQTVTDFETSTRKLEEELSGVRAQLVQSESRAGASQAEAARLNETLPAVEAEKAQLASQCEELTTTVAQLRAEIAKLTEQHERLTQTANESQQELHAVKQAKSGAEAQRDEMRRELEEAKGVLADAEENYLSERLWVGQLAQERATLSARISQLEQEMTQLHWYRAHTQRLESELKALTS